MLGREREGGPPECHAHAKSWSWDDRLLQELTITRRRSRLRSTRATPQASRRGRVSLARSSLAGFKVLRREFAGFGHDPRRNEGLAQFVTGKTLHPDYHMVKPPLRLPSGLRRACRTVRPGGRARR